MQFEESTLAEVTFLAELVRRTGCGLLLDVNNVFVASTNHGLDPRAYIAAFPLHGVGEVHLGGQAPAIDEGGAPLLIDSHDTAVTDPVWALYDELIARIGPVASLVEWDNDVPDWPVLRREVETAQAVLDRRTRTIAA